MDGRYHSCRCRYHSYTFFFLILLKYLTRADQYTGQPFSFIAGYNMVFFDIKKRKHCLTKQDISAQISNRLRFSPVKSKHLVEETLEIIKSTLERI